MATKNLGRVVGKSAYEIWLNEGNIGTIDDFLTSLVGKDGIDGTDGRGIVKIEKTSSEGLVDTYTITYTDNTTSSFNVTNGKDGSGSGGTTNHASLENLDFEDSGHTGFQKELISGTNIKTLNGQSILGEGNINIEGSESSQPFIHTFSEAYTKWCSGETFPILFCGDSTIAGYGTTDASGKTKAFPKRLEEKLKYECSNDNVTIYNVAVSGSTLPDASKFDEWFGTSGSYKDVKMVGIGWGINDRLAFKTKEAYYNDVFSKIEALILKAFGYGIQPFLLTTQATAECGVQSSYTSTYPLRNSENINTCANNAKRDLARKYNLEIIDLNMFTELYLKNSSIAIKNIIPDNLHFNDRGNLYEAGVVFMSIVNRTILIENNDKKTISYADQHIVTTVPEDKVSFGGDLKMYANYTKSDSSDLKIFDAYIFIKDYSATIEAYKLSTDSSTYVVIDSEVSEDAKTINLTKTKTQLSDLELGLHHLEVYTDESTKVDFAGFIINNISSQPSNIPLEAITFTSDTYTTGTNQSIQTALTFTPANATNKKVTYVASGGTISTTGLFVATEAGNYTITATSDDGNYTTTCTVEVIAPVAVTGITLNQSTANMTKGDILNLTATIEPSNATDKTIIWSVDNSLCSVENGVVTCLSSTAGTSIVTAKTRDGNYTATCTITITVTEDILFDNTTIYASQSLPSFVSSVAPAALFFNYNSQDLTCAFSGKTITSIKVPVTQAGTFSVGTVPLTKGTLSKNSVTWLSAFTITDDDIIDGYATIKLDNLSIGEHDTLAVYRDTDTAKTSYLPESANPTPTNSNSKIVISNGTYATNKIGYVCKVTGLN